MIEHPVLKVVDVKEEDVLVLVSGILERKRVRRVDKIEHDLLLHWIRVEVDSHSASVELAHQHLVNQELLLIFCTAARTR